MKVTCISIGYASERARATVASHQEAIVDQPTIPMLRISILLLSLRLSACFSAASAHGKWMTVAVVVLQMKQSREFTG